jgi:hypothetical protein
MCKSTCGTNSRARVADLNAFGVGNGEDNYAKLNSDADEDFDVLAMMTSMLLKRIWRDNLILGGGCSQRCHQQRLCK